MSNDLVFVPSNLLEQRERENRSVQGLKKFRLMGEGWSTIYHATTYVLLLTRRVAYQPTCRACKSNGLWSNNSALCAATRHQAKANTRFTAHLHFRKLSSPPTTFPLPLPLPFESNEKITLNTSRKSLSQLCLLNSTIDRIEDLKQVNSDFRSWISTSYFEYSKVEMHGYLVRKYLVQSVQTYVISAKGSLSRSCQTRASLSPSPPISPKRRNVQYRIPRKRRYPSIHPPSFQIRENMSIRTQTRYKVSIMIRSNRFEF